MLCYFEFMNLLLRSFVIPGCIFRLTSLIKMYIHFIKILRATQYFSNTPFHVICFPWPYKCFIQWILVKKKVPVRYRYSLFDSRQVLNLSHSSNASPSVKMLVHLTFVHRHKNTLNSYQMFMAYFQINV
jgi:hypothetical protein